MKAQLSINHMGMYAEKQRAQRRETGGDANGGNLVKVQMHLKMNTDSAHQQQQQSESTNNKSSTNNNNKQHQQQRTKLALVHPMSFPHSSTSLHIHHIHIPILSHSMHIGTSTTPKGSIHAHKHTHTHTHTCSSSMNIHPSIRTPFHPPWHDEAHRSQYKNKTKK
jgi:hypothetical protein